MEEFLSSSSTLHLASPTPSLGTLRKSFIIFTCVTCLHLCHRTLVPIVCDRVSDCTLGRSWLQGFDPATTPTTDTLVIPLTSLYGSLLIPFHLLDSLHHCYFLAPITFYCPSTKESRIALDTEAVNRCRDAACGFFDNTSFIARISDI